MLPYGPKWSKMVHISPKLYKGVQNGNKIIIKISKLSKNGQEAFKMVLNGPIISQFSKMVEYGPVLSKTVQNGQKKSLKLYKMARNGAKTVWIHFKLFYKITAVGATAVGVTAVRNNLKF